MIALPAATSSSATLAVSLRPTAMSYDPHNTIAAISSPPGGGARGILRVSGPATFEIVAKCFAAISKDPKRSTSCATISRGHVKITRDGIAGWPIPCDLLLWPGQRSYTREPVAEFHTLGSPMILNALRGVVCSAGARLAGPGEFTLRAFLAGRLDLTQAEAVLGVIDAHEQSDLDTALCQLSGGLARPLHQLRDELLQLLAELEAGLDFVEDDIEFISRQHLQLRLTTAATEIEAIAAQLSTRLAANRIPRVVLFGPPNAGKSSLFNALAASTASAIVSPQRGTTRDYLFATLDLGAFQCELIDSAGIEFGFESASDFGINVLAQLQTTELREQSFLRALCIDTTARDADVWLNHSHEAADLIVITKADLDANSATHFAASAEGIPTIITSSVTGEGLPQLRRCLAAALDSIRAEHLTNCVAATANRCRDSLCLAAAAIHRARETSASIGGDELIAAELREALTELGKVVGTIYTDDILDRIFSSFCIGK